MFTIGTLSSPRLSSSVLACLLGLSAATSGCTAGKVELDTADCETDADGDGAVACVDCDDADPEAYAGHGEYCDGIDNNCNGEIDETGGYLYGASSWYPDEDRDGYGDADAEGIVACDRPDSGYTTDHDDCDDTVGTVNPDGDEVCDEIDNDCDGDVDSDDTVLTPDYYLWEDKDGDGFGDEDADKLKMCDGDEVPEGTYVDDAGTEYTFGYVEQARDCDDLDPYVYYGAEEICDDIDNDCNDIKDDDLGTETYYYDADGDGYGENTVYVTACDYFPSLEEAGYVPYKGDCMPTNPDVHPGAVEEWYDGVNNDCDEDDDCDQDHDGYLSDIEFCGGTDCEDWLSTYNPGAAEVCNTRGYDEDCDDLADDADPDCEDAETVIDDDGDGYPADEDCDDSNRTINPEATESCDEVDNDCDGEIDEDDASDAGTWYADSDGDGYGNSEEASVSCAAPTGYVEDGTDCDDGDDGINPAATETADDGIDQDCDGSDLETSSGDPVIFYSEDFETDSGSCTVGDFVRSDGGTIHQTSSCWILIQEGGTATEPVTSIDITLSGMTIGTEYTFTWQVGNQFEAAGTTIVADVDRGTPDTGTFTYGDTGTLETTWTANSTSVTARIWTTGDSYYDGVLTSFVVTTE